MRLCRRRGKDGYFHREGGGKTKTFPQHSQGVVWGSRSRYFRPRRCGEDKNSEKGAYFRSGVVGVVSHDISAPSLGDSRDCGADIYFRLTRVGNHKESDRAAYFRPEGRKDAGSGDRRFPTGPLFPGALGDKGDFRAPVRRSGNFHGGAVERG